MCPASRVPGIILTLCVLFVHFSLNQCWIRRDHGVKPTPEVSSSTLDGSPGLPYPGHHLT
ncbi:hypothetical protein I79_008206 [Cricetulus griseus]|uniref:Uncharacterized protein n=1 Tax=Cricetulus griseus TaxID=10029 RepID=G3HCJ5_CRIGR|nr:hypothetical protein I79_008206 [Cricetulus griseus]